MELISLLHDPALAGPHDVEVDGDFAYIAGKWGAFTVVDISDPVNPRIVGAVTEGVDNAQTVQLLGEGRILLGANEMLTLDVSDPARPTVTARLRHPDIQRINGMVQRDGIVFAANKSHVIDVFDISDPGEVRLLDTFDTQQTGIVSPHDAALLGDWLITVDQRKDAENKVQVIRVWDAGYLPCSKWPVVDTVADGRLNGANRVCVSGSTAYVACNYGDTIGALDIDGEGKVTLGHIVETSDVAPCGIEIDGDHLYAGAAAGVERFDIRGSVLESEGTLCVFDSERARHPKQRGKGDAHDLVCREGLLYVTGQNDDSLAIVKTGGG